MEINNSKKEITVALKQDDLSAKPEKHNLAIVQIDNLGKAIDALQKLLNKVTGDLKEEIEKKELNSKRPPYISLAEFLDSYLVQCLSNYTEMIREIVEKLNSCLF